MIAPAVQKSKAWGSALASRKKPSVCSQARSGACSQRIPGCSPTPRCYSVIRHP